VISPVIKFEISLAHCISNFIQPQAIVQFLENNTHPTNQKFLDFKKLTAAPENIKI
jgi:hypothetical protein